MSTQNYVILTSAQKDTAEGLDAAPFLIEPRAIDNAAPGVGININPDADGVDAGDVVTLVGKFVAPKRIVDDPQCLIHCPALATYLLTLPWAMLENETIFAPNEDW